MKLIHLVRCETGDEGTFGALFIRDRFQYYTLELPYRDENKDGLSDKGTSCLPAGVYAFHWVKSPKHGWCYEMMPSELAPNRDHIQFHAANWAGDKKKGYYCQLEGCIALGFLIGEMMLPGKSVKQKGISNSKKAITEFNLMMKNQPFELNISWGDGALG